MDTGVARAPIADMAAYRSALRERIAKAQARTAQLIATL